MTSASRTRRRAALRWLALFVLLTALAALGVSLVPGVPGHQTMRHHVKHFTGRLELRGAWLDRLLAPPPRFGSHTLDGQVRRSHPRILLPELAKWQPGQPVSWMQDRLERYEILGEGMPHPCTLQEVLAHAACYLLHGDPLHAERLLTALERYEIQPPASQTQYGNLATLALAFDLLMLAPDLPKTRLQSVHQRIAKAVEELLPLLDDTGASVWHGRASLSAHAWLGAIVLDPEDPRAAQLQTRAQAHFLENMEALAISEAWPEGYSYWINERGLLLALAGSAYVNGLTGARNAAGMVSTLKRAAYWMLYTTRPDDRVEGHGDEGPRVDLKDETRRVIDVIAQLTRDPALAGYSTYIRTLHGPASYFTGYRGQFALFNDPTLPVAGTHSLEAAASHLPLSDHFGPGAMDLVVIRSGWGANDTFITLRAGASLSHHGHYDAGHFSVFKHAPLAVNSSTYTTLLAPNRLEYSVNSIAKNTVLIRHRDLPPEAPAGMRAGGQRTPMATSNPLHSVTQWLQMSEPGQPLSGGQVLEFRDSENAAYVRADLTPAYLTQTMTGTRRLIRELVYLRREDRVLIHDQLQLAYADATRAWLLHTIHRPQLDGLRLVQGSSSNGILHSASPRAVVRNGKARMEVTRLFPKSALFRLIGGEDYRYLVEQHSDSGDLRAFNAARGASGEPWFDQASWRLELTATEPRSEDRFLVALSLSPDAKAPRSVRAGEILGALSAGSLTLFLPFDSTTGQAQFAPAQWPARLHVTGLPYDARLDIVPAMKTEGDRGSLRSFRLPEDYSGPLEVRWQSDRHVGR